MYAGVISILSGRVEIGSRSERGRLTPFGIAIFSSLVVVAVVIVQMHAILCQLLLLLVQTINFLLWYFEFKLAPVRQLFAALF